jgi:hypothetical protein
MGSLQEIGKLIICLGKSSFDVLPLSNHTFGNVREVFLEAVLGYFYQCCRPLGACELLSFQNTFWLRKHGKVGKREK